MSKYYGMFVNLGDPMNRWKLDEVVRITSLIKEYADKHNLKDVELLEVEDNRWEDEVNQRIDVEIVYPDTKGIMIQQKLLILKGEILDGKEFHKRAEEFYPRKAGK